MRPSRLPVCLAACTVALLAASPTQAQISYERYTDPEGQFTIMLPDGAEPSSEQPGALGEWRLPSGAAIWLETRAATPTEDLTVYEQVVLDTVQGRLDDGWSLAGSSRLDEVALAGHGVEQGLGVRLSNPITSSAAVVVMLEKGPTVYLLWVLMPPDVARDAKLGRALSEVVSSLRITGEAVASSSVEGEAPVAGAGPVDLPGGILPSLIVEEPAILAGRAASFAYAFTGGDLDGWSWELGDGTPAPVPSPGEGLAFTSEGDSLFSADRPAPLLTRPPLVPPLEAVVELSSATDAASTGPVQLTLCDSPTRAMVLTITREDATWMVEGLLRRHSREERRQTPVSGSSLWARMMSDGEACALYVSGDGARWHPILAGEGPRPLRLDAPRLGIAMPGTAPPCARVSRVSVLAMPEMPQAPRAEGQAFAPRRVADTVGAAPLMVSGAFGLPAGARVVQADLLISVGDREVAARFVRASTEAPLELAEDSDPAIVCHSVVPRADGGLTILVGLDTGVIDGEAKVVVHGRAFTDSGLGTGTWKLVPGAAQALKEGGG